jgi:hypothetical protein
MMKDEVEFMPKDAIPCLQSYTGLIYISYNKAGISHKDPSIQEMSNCRRSQIRGQQITGDPTRIKRKVMQEEIMKNYYKRKLGDSYENIEWTVFKKALAKKSAKGALLKMIHGVTPTQKHMKKV